MYSDQMVTTLSTLADGGQAKTSQSAPGPLSNTIPETLGNFVEDKIDCVF